MRHCILMIVMVRIGYYRYYDEREKLFVVGNTDYSLRVGCEENCLVGCGQEMRLD